MRKETGEDFLWTISSHPFHPLFDPSTIPHPAQGNEHMKKKKEFWGGSLGVKECGAPTNQINHSESAFPMSPHLIEPFSSDSVACTDVPRLVHQPLQPESLRHFHAGHCVPAKQSQALSWAWDPPAVHLIGKEKNGKPPCLDVWVLQKVAKSFGAFPAETDTRPSIFDTNCLHHHHHHHLKQHVQLVLRHHHPQSVAGVNHKDDALVKGVLR